MQPEFRVLKPPLPLRIQEAPRGGVHLFSGIAHSGSSDQARASSSTSISDRMPTIERPLSRFFLHRFVY